MRNPSTSKLRAKALAASALVALLSVSMQAQAPDTASLDDILRRLASYDGGKDSSAEFQLRAYVRGRMEDPAERAECEQKLLLFLKSEATPPAKMAACRQLRLIAGENAVPALEPMLLGGDTADMALYVLQGIAGAAVDDALLRALSRTAETTRNAVIAAVGDRKLRAAIPELTRLLDDERSAGAAARALARIGGEAACGALRDARARGNARTRSAAAGPLLECAERWAAQGNRSAAASLYDEILHDSGLAPAVRAAALMGGISSSESGAAALVMQYVRDPDRRLQEAAIVKIKEVVPPEAIAPICDLVPELGEEARVKLLAVLSVYPRERVLPAIVQAARSDAPAVRHAALKALESVGDASVVPFLVEIAARSRGPEQGAARSALGALRGRAVDEAVLGMLARGQPDDLRAELIQAAGERRIYAAKSAVAEALASPSRRVRAQALKTLRLIGTPSDIPAILGYLAGCDDELEQAEAGATAAALAQKIADPRRRAAAVRARLEGEKDPNGRLVREENPAARARLYRLLGSLGDDSALPLLRAALGDLHEETADAAARTIIAWPTRTAWDDVLRLAVQSPDETHRLLAVRALVRLASQDEYRKPEAAVTDLRKILYLASRPEEKKLVLGALPRFPCPDALELAGDFLGEPGLAAEAGAAIRRIQARLAKKPAP